MTREQIKRLVNKGYTALVRGHHDVLFVPVKGDKADIAEHAVITPLAEDEIILLWDALEMDDESLEFLGEIRTPMRVLVPA